MSIMADIDPATFEVVKNALYAAAEEGRQSDLLDLLFAAYFTQGLDIGDADVLSALVNLGYQRAAADKALDRAVASGGAALDIEGLLRAALRHLGR